MVRMICAACIGVAVSKHGWCAESATGEMSELRGGWVLFSGGEGVWNRVGLRLSVLEGVVDAEFGM